MEATEDLITSPLFKKVYNLYSKWDIAQVCQPQRFRFCFPVFCGRTFKPMANLSQAQILLDGRHPDHNDFVLKPEFITKLPALLEQLDNAKLKQDDHCKADIRADATVLQKK